MTEMFDPPPTTRPSSRPGENGSQDRRSGGPHSGASRPGKSRPDGWRAEQRLERLRAERPRRAHPRSNEGLPETGGAQKHHDRPRMDPRFAERWVEARREEGRRRLRALIVVAVVVGVAALGLGSLYSPFFSVRHVKVAVADRGPIAASKIKALAALSGRRMMDANGGAVAGRIDADPWLADAKVDLKWPSTVDIQVTERKPLAQVEVEYPGKWAQVDVTGRVLQLVSSRNPHLPALSDVGRVPTVGAWLAGAPGPTAPATALAPWINVNAQSDSTNAPSGTSAALGFLDLLPSSLRPYVVSLRANNENDLTLALAVKRDPVPVQVVLGDSSQLAAKAGALETLTANRALAGVSAVNLSVPTRPALTPSAGGM